MAFPAALGKYNVIDPEYLSPCVCTHCLAEKPASQIVIKDKLQISSIPTIRGIDINEMPSTLYSGPMFPNMVTDMTICKCSSCTHTGVLLYNLTPTICQNINNKSNTAKSRDIGSYRTPSPPSQLIIPDSTRSSTNNEYNSPKTPPSILHSIYSRHSRDSSHNTSTINSTASSSGRHPPIATSTTLSLSSNTRDSPHINQSASSSYAVGDPHSSMNNMVITTPLHSMTNGTDGATNMPITTPTPSSTAPSSSQVINTTMSLPPSPALPVYPDQHQYPTIMTEDTTITPATTTTTLDPHNNKLIFCLHGAGFSNISFVPLAQTLAQTLENNPYATSQPAVLIAPNLRGHGDSYSPFHTEQLSYRQFLQLNDKEMHMTDSDIDTVLLNSSINHNIDTTTSHTPDMNDCSPKTTTNNNDKQSDDNDNIINHHDTTTSHSTPNNKHTTTTSSKLLSSSSSSSSQLSRHSTIPTTTTLKQAPVHSSSTSSLHLSRHGGSSTTLASSVMGMTGGAGGGSGIPIHGGGSSTTLSITSEDTIDRVLSTPNIPSPRVQISLHNRAPSYGDQFSSRLSHYNNTPTSSSHSSSTNSINKHFRNSHTLTTPLIATTTSSAAKIDLPSSAKIDLPSSAKIDLPSSAKIDHTISFPTSPKTPNTPSHLSIASTTKGQSSITPHLAHVSSPSAPSPSAATSTSQSQSPSLQHHVDSISSQRRVDHISSNNIISSVQSTDDLNRSDSTSNIQSNHAKHVNDSTSHINDDDDHNKKNKNKALTDDNYDTTTTTTDNNNNNNNRDNNNNNNNDNNNNNNNDNNNNNNNNNDNNNNNHNNDNNDNPLLVTSINHAAEILYPALKPHILLLDLLTILAYLPIVSQQQHNNNTTYDAVVDNKNIFLSSSPSATATTPVTSHHRRPLETVTSCTSATPSQFSSSHSASTSRSISTRLTSPAAVDHSSGTIMTATSTLHTSTIIPHELSTSYDLHGSTSTLATLLNNNNNNNTNNNTQFITDRTHNTTHANQNRSNNTPLSPSLISGLPTDPLNTSSPIHIVGHSLGGALACHLAVLLGYISQIGYMYHLGMTCSLLSRQMAKRVGLTRHGPRGSVDGYRSVQSQSLSSHHHQSNIPYEEAWQNVDAVSRENSFDDMNGTNGTGNTTSTSAASSQTRTSISMTSPSFRPSTPPSALQPQPELTATTMNTQPNRNVIKEHQYASAPSSFIHFPTISSSFDAVYTPESISILDNLFTHDSLSLLTNNNPLHMAILTLLYTNHKSYHSLSSLSSPTKNTIAHNTTQYDNSPCYINKNNYSIMFGLFCRRYQVVGVSALDSHQHPVLSLLKLAAARLPPGHNIYPFISLENPIPEPSQSLIKAINVFKPDNTTLFQENTTNINDDDKHLNTNTQQDKPSPQPIIASSDDAVSSDAVIIPALPRGTNHIPSSYSQTVAVAPSSSNHQLNNINPLPSSSTRNSLPSPHIRPETQTTSQSPIAPNPSATDSISRPPSNTSRHPIQEVSRPPLPFHPDMRDIRDIRDIGPTNHHHNTNMNINNHHDITTTRRARDRYAIEPNPSQKLRSMSTSRTPYPGTRLPPPSRHHGIVLHSGLGYPDARSSFSISNHMVPNAAMSTAIAQSLQAVQTSHPSYNSGAITPLQQQQQQPQSLQQLQHQGQFSQFPHHQTAPTSAMTTAATSSLLEEDYSIGRGSGNDQSLFPLSSHRYTSHRPGTGAPAPFGVGPSPHSHRPVHADILPPPGSTLSSIDGDTDPSGSASVWRATRHHNHHGSHWNRHETVSQRAIDDDRPLPGPHHMGPSFHLRDDAHHHHRHDNHATRDHRSISSIAHALPLLNSLDDNQLQSQPSIQGIQSTKNTQQQQQQHGSQQIMQQHGSQQQQIQPQQQPITHHIPSSSLSMHAAQHSMSPSFPRELNNRELTNSYNSMLLMQPPLAPSPISPQDDHLSMYKNHEQITHRQSVLTPSNNPNSKSSIQHDTTWSRLPNMANMSNNNIVALPPPTPSLSMATTPSIATTTEQRVMISSQQLQSQQQQQHTTPSHIPYSGLSIASPYNHSIYDQAMRSSRATPSVTGSTLSVHSSRQGTVEPSTPSLSVTGRSLKPSRNQTNDTSTPMSPAPPPPPGPIVPLSRVPPRLHLANYGPPSTRLQSRVPSSHTGGTAQDAINHDINALSSLSQHTISTLGSSRHHDDIGRLSGGQANNPDQLPIPMTSTSDNKSTLFRSSSTQFQDHDDDDVDDDRVGDDSPRASDIINGHHWPESHMGDGLPSESSISSSHIHHGSQRSHQHRPHHRHHNRSHHQHHHHNDQQDILRHTINTITPLAQSLRQQKPLKNDDLKQDQISSDRASSDLGDDTLRDTGGGVPTLFPMDTSSMNHQVFFPRSVSTFTQQYSTSGGGSSENGIGNTLSIDNNDDMSINNQNHISIHDNHNKNSKNKNDNKNKNINKLHNIDDIHSHSPILISNHNHLQSLRYTSSTDNTLGIHDDDDDNDDDDTTPFLPQILELQRSQSVGGAGHGSTPGNTTTSLVSNIPMGTIGISVNLSNGSNDRNNITHTTTNSTNSTGADLYNDSSDNSSGNHSSELIEGQSSKNNKDTKSTLLRFPNATTSLLSSSDTSSSVSLSFHGTSLHLNRDLSSHSSHTRNTSLGRRSSQASRTYHPYDDRHDDDDAKYNSDDDSINNSNNNNNNNILLYDASNINGNNRSKNNNNTNNDTTLINIDPSQYYDTNASNNKNYPDFIPIYPLTPLPQTATNGLQPWLSYGLTSMHSDGKVAYATGLSAGTDGHLPTPAFRDMTSSSSTGLHYNDKHPPIDNVTPNLSPSPSSSTESSQDNPLNHSNNQPLTLFNNGSYNKDSIINNTSSPSLHSPRNYSSRLTSSPGQYIDHNPTQQQQKQQHQHNQQRFIDHSDSFSHIQPNHNDHSRDNFLTTETHSAQIILVNPSTQTVLGTPKPSSRQRAMTYDSSHSEDDENMLNSDAIGGYLSMRNNHSAGAGGGAGGAGGGDNGSSNDNNNGNNIHHGNAPPNLAVTLSRHSGSGGDHPHPHRHPHDKKQTSPDHSNLPHSARTSLHSMTPLLLGPPSQPSPLLPQLSTSNNDAIPLLHASYIHKTRDIDHDNAATTTTNNNNNTNNIDQFRPATPLRIPSNLSNHSSGLHHTNPPSPLNQRGVTTTPPIGPYQPSNALSTNQQHLGEHASAVKTTHFFSRPGGGGGQSSRFEQGNIINNSNNNNSMIPSSRFDLRNTQTSGYGPLASSSLSSQAVQTASQLAAHHHHAMVAAAASSATSSTINSTNNSSVNTNIGNQSISHHHHHHNNNNNNIPSIFGSSTNILQSSPLPYDESYKNLRRSSISSHHSIITPNRSTVFKPRDASPAPTYSSRANQAVTVAPFTPHGPSSGLAAISVASSAASRHHHLQQHQHGQHGQQQQQHLMSYNNHHHHNNSSNQLNTLQMHDIDGLLDYQAQMSQHGDDLARMSGMTSSALSIVRSSHGGGGGGGAGGGGGTPAHLSSTMAPSPGGPSLSLRKGRVGNSGLTQHAAFGSSGMHSPSTSTLSLTNHIAPPDLVLNPPSVAPSAGGAGWITPALSISKLRQFNKYSQGIHTLHHAAASTALTGSSIHSVHDTIDTHSHLHESGVGGMQQEQHQPDVHVSDLYIPHITHRPSIWYSLKQLSTYLLDTSLVVTEQASHLITPAHVIPVNIAALCLPPDLTGDNTGNDNNHDNNSLYKVNYYDSQSYHRTSQPMTTTVTNTTPQYVPANRPMSSTADALSSSSRDFNARRDVNSIKSNVDNNNNNISQAPLQRQPPQHSSLVQKRYNPHLRRHSVSPSLSSQSDSDGDDDEDKAKNNPSTDNSHPTSINNNKTLSTSNKASTSRILPQITAPAYQCAQTSSDMSTGTIALRIASIHLNPYTSNITPHNSMQNTAHPPITSLHDEFQTVMPSRRIEDTTIDKDITPILQHSRLLHRSSSETASPIGDIPPASSNLSILGNNNQNIDHSSNSLIKTHPVTAHAMTTNSPPTIGAPTTAAPTNLLVPPRQPNNNNITYPSQGFIWRIPTSITMYYSSQWLIGYPNSIEIISDIRGIYTRQYKLYYESISNMISTMALQQYSKISSLFIQQQQQQQHQQPQLQQQLPHRRGMAGSTQNNAFLNDNIHIQSLFKESQLNTTPIPTSSISQTVQTPSISQTVQTVPTIPTTSTQTSSYSSVPLQNALSSIIRPLPITPVSVLLVYQRNSDLDPQLWMALNDPTIKNIKHVEIDGSHCCHIDQPSSFHVAEALTRFLYLDTTTIHTVGAIHSNSNGSCGDNDGKFIEII